MDRNILLLHGWGANTGKLQPLASELKRLGWNVFLVKLPGFDRKPPKKAWQVSDYSEFTENKASKYFVGKKYFTFGHSFGGRVAMKMALDRSEKKSGLILCATSGVSRTSGAKRYLFVVISKIGKILLVIPHLALLLRKVLYKVAKVHDYEHAKGAMRETFKRVVAENFREVVRNINRPTLILWGEKDKMVPVKDAHYLNNNIKGSKMKTWEEEGHTLPYKKPKEIAQEINKWATSLQ